MLHEVSNQDHNLVGKSAANNVFSLSYKWQVNKVDPQYWEYWAKPVLCPRENLHTKLFKLIYSGFCTENMRNLNILTK